MEKNRLILFLLVLVLACGLLLTVIPLQAKAETSGDWMYEVSGSNATITDYSGSATNLTIPSTLGGYTVTRIGEEAFRACGTLVNVSIPSSITRINDGAFENCTALESISIPSSVTYIAERAFYNCTALKSIELPSVTKIDVCTFYGCTSLTEVTLSESLSTIADKAFMLCGALSKIDIPESVSTIGDGAFKNCASLTSIEIPKKVSYFGSGVLSSCPALVSIEVDKENSTYYSENNCIIKKNGKKLMQGCKASKIPSNVKSIEAYAFSGCTTLSSITIPVGVESIGAYAFNNCTSITSVEVPSGVTSIGTYTFDKCTSLKELTIPASVTTMGNCVVSKSCSALEKIYCGAASCPAGWNSNWKGYAPASVRWGYHPDYEYTLSDGEATITKYVGLGGNIVIPSSIDGYSVVGIGTNAFYGCSALVSVDIPEGIKSIGYASFRECTSLTNVTLPDGLNSIAQEAFIHCRSLKTITIPTSVTSIGSYAFEYCTSLESISIPDTVTTVGRRMFYGCQALTSVSLPSGMTMIGQSMFGECASLVSITLPAGVTKIDEFAFYMCTSLEELVLPETVTYISGNVFQGCTALKTFSLSGNVTTVGGNVFDGCASLTDIYCDVSSKPNGWNDNWLGNCTATVHWTIETDTNLVFSGASVTLFDDLTVNFKANASLFETYTSPYVVFEQNGAEVTVSEYTVDGGYYVFAFAGVLPNRMNDEISATLYATVDGAIYKSEAKAYSVATYCYNMLGKYGDDEKLRTLLVDILNYGAATQVYTNHNTANLANAALTDEQKAWASPERDYTSVENDRYEEIANSAVTWIGAGLNLSESIAVRYEFTAESVEGLTAKVTCGGKTWEVADFSTNEKGEDVLLVRLNAGYMSEPIYVTLYDGETAVSNTVCYSIESYAFTYGDDSALGDLVRAMMKYGDAASAYITKG